MQLNIHQWTGIKIDRRATNTVNKEFEARSSGNFFKSLVSKKMIDIINKKASEIRQAHNKHSLPFMDNGARIVPVSAYFEYIAIINELKREFNDLADTFCSKYDEMLNDAKNRLGHLYRAKDYPAKDVIREKFSIVLTPLPFPESSDLRMELEDEEFATIKAEFEEQMDSTIGKAEKSLWDRLDKDVIAFMNTMEDGSRIYDTTIHKLGPLCELVPTLNFTGMEGVQEVCDEIKRNLTNHSPDEIRKDGNLRAELKGKSKLILDKITRNRYGV